jgi:hypothetical protein
VVARRRSDPGATAAVHRATTAGSYACIVTARNQSGPTSQGSGPVEVTPPAVRLVVRPRNAKARPGKRVKFSVTARNGGDLPAANTVLCLRVPRSAKRELKPQTCKLRPSAEGRYKLKIALRGSPNRPQTATLKALG